MSNEIKQGDKVRVSKDAPKLYTDGWRFDWRNLDSVVGILEGDDATITPIDDGGEELSIPCKYLVKVDAEAKEAKYHKDDKVCINKSSLKHGLRGEILTIIGVDVSDRTYYVQSRCMRSPIWLREDEISLYTEPTAPKFKVGDRVRFKNIYELQKVKDKSFRWMLVMFASKEATITAVEDNGFYRVDIDPSIGGINDDMIECKVEPIATKYKVGDWVMISGVFNPQLNGMIGWISRIDKDGNKVSFQDGRFAIVEDKYLTLTDRPMEQSPAEKFLSERAAKSKEQAKLFLDIDGLIEPPFRTIPKIMFNTEFWVKYAADLAKEVALKVANKYNAPEQAAEYAVKVAKEVVEGLKRK